MPKAKPAIELKPPGTLLAEFTVPGRAVPWKAPTTTRTGHSFKDHKLFDWQNLIWLYAVKERAIAKYEGPVKITIHVWLKRRRGSAPDITNLQKAIEDALQNSVIVNDRQARAISSRLDFDEDERVLVVVEAF